MKFDVLYFIKFCLKCNQILHKQKIIRDTFNADDKRVDE